VSSAHRAGQIGNDAANAPVHTPLSDHEPLLVIHVKELASGRVAGAVNRVLKSLDRHATIEIDLTRQRVAIGPSSADAEDLIEILTSAGFTATVVAANDHMPVALADRRKSPFAWDRMSGAQKVAGALESRSLLPPEALGPLELPKIP
jgi:hypothetical protein